VAENLKPEMKKIREGFVSKEIESSEELDDEYLPACCPIGKTQSHPI